MQRRGGRETHEKAEDEVKSKDYLESETSRFRKEWKRSEIRRKERKEKRRREEREKKRRESQKKKWLKVSNFPLHQAQKVVRSQSLRVTTTQRLDTSSSPSQSPLIPHSL